MGNSILPEVHDEFLCLRCIKQQVVVLTPCSQTTHLLPVGRLIAVLDEANKSGVVRNLNDGVGAMFRSAVVGEERVEEQTKHTALWWRSSGCLTKHVATCWSESLVTTCR